MKTQRLQIPKAISRKNKAGGSIIPDFKLYYDNQNSTVLSHKQIYRSMGQNREPRNEPTHIFCQLIYGKVSKNIQWGKTQPLQ